MNIPYFLIAGLALGLVAMFAANPVSKKNNTFGGLLPFIGVLLMIAGLVCECLI